MDKGQKGFIVYGDIKATLDELNDKQAADLFRGMVDYFVDGTEPNFNGILKFVFIPIRQQMDRDREKYDEKCERNRANANKRWNAMRSDAVAYDGMRSDAMDANTNKNKNTNTNKDTNTNTKSVETDVSSLPSFLIGYLNEKAGTNYNVTKSVSKQIEGLVADGYSPDQMRTVIDRKCDEWLTDEKMRTYLRPSTLFGDKFGEYVSAPISLTTERKQDEAKKRKSLEADLVAKQSSLEELRSSLEEIPRGTRMDERRALKDQIAQLEDSIVLIERRLAS